MTKLSQYRKTCEILIKGDKIKYWECKSWRLSMAAKCTKIKTKINIIKSAEKAIKIKNKKISIKRKIVNSNQWHFIRASDSEWDVNG